MHITSARLLRSTFAVLAATCLAACAPSEVERVHGNVEVLGTSGSALSDGGGYVLEGTYGAGCDEHADDGTDSWTSANLAVIKNDTDCELTVTGILRDGVAYRAPSNLLLSTQFADASLRFASLVTNGPIDSFLANAKLSSTAFDSDFTITLLTSPGVATSDRGNRGSEYAMESASVSASEVPAPSYSASFFYLDILTDVDHVVQEGGVTGWVTLLPEGDADRFAVYEGEVPADLDTVETAFGEGMPITSLDEYRIPAPYFTGLEGDDLDTHRVYTIMIRNSVADVRAYQLLYITFTP